MNPDDFYFLHPMIIMSRWLITWSDLRTVSRAAEVAKKRWSLILRWQGRRSAVWRSALNNWPRSTGISVWLKNPPHQHWSAPPPAVLELQQRKREADSPSSLPRKYWRKLSGKRRRMKFPRWVRRLGRKGLLGGEKAGGNTKILSIRFWI